MPISRRGAFVSGLDTSWLPLGADLLGAYTSWLPLKCPACPNLVVSVQAGVSLCSIWEDDDPAAAFFRTQSNGEGEWIPQNPPFAFPKHRVGLIGRSTFFLDVNRFYPKTPLS